MPVKEACGIGPRQTRGVAAGPVVAVTPAIAPSSGTTV
jgi:hypothetical protein